MMFGTYNKENLGDKEMRFGLHVAKDGKAYGILADSTR